MKIWHISDTHTYHGLLEIPEWIDTVIFSGDCSNPRNPYLNEQEVLNFIEWFSKLPIKNKIMIAGNHDSSIENGFITKEFIQSKGIYYLENSGIILDGINIWGSPHAPTFGDWSFMKARAKLDRVWQNIPKDVNILIVHGPPKGFLDLTYNRNRDIERCGCNALKKRVLEIEPDIVMFGHIHNYKDIVNAGTMRTATSKTIYSNGSVVTDNEFGILSSNGNILEI